MPLVLRAFLGASAYGRSFGGGGWISRFGRAETVAVSVSERRIVGTDVDGRRVGCTFLEGMGVGGGGGVGGFFTTTGCGST